MPVPIPGPEVGSDSLKVKFLMISGRPKNWVFGTFPGPRDTAPPCSYLWPPTTASCITQDARRFGNCVLSEPQPKHKMVVNVPALWPT